jgi:hypothetical protein
MSAATNRRPKGQSTGGQFAPSPNPEATVEITGNLRRTVGAVIDGIVYRVDIVDNGNDTVSYTLTDPLCKGGWNFEYDRLTRRARANGRRPNLSALSDGDSAAWRDRGEADIRSAVAMLEPNAVLVQHDGQTFHVDGRQGWASASSTLWGLNSGQMMLTSGADEGRSYKRVMDEIAKFVKEQRERDEIALRDHDDLAGAVAETERYLVGIELAVEMGTDAALANTVGAQRARGLA